MHERSNFTTKLYPKKKKTIEVANQIQRTLSNMVHDEAKITNKLRIQTGEFV
jgi:predicted CopG family antitoxin